jgi:hypothetical protein
MGYLAPAPLHLFLLPHSGTGIGFLSILDLTNPKHCNLLVQDTSRSIEFAVGWDSVGYGDWLVGGCLFVLSVWFTRSSLHPLGKRRVVSCVVVMVVGRLCAADEDVVEGDVDWERIC